ncbi:MAG: tripartite tricarboxylate transporter substrate binding protein [Burkholderiaceae bacterium]|nr:tripartite tricarboxylate transporter substrate binding protein [Burkholderiaceae bacterium]
MIVAFGAGGSTDTMARIFANYIGEELGQRFVVENREGAGGEIGWIALANAAPDGYTIGLVNSPAIEVYPITRPDTIGYSLDQFRPLLNVVTDPGVLAVAADSPYQTLEDFVAAARANPGTITVSHEGIGGDDHLAALRLADRAGIELNFVSFNGNAEATAALLGGHIDAFEGNMSEAAAQIGEGSVRALAVWSSDRMAQIPDVSTGTEQGYDIISAASRGIAVPVGVSDEVYQTLLKASARVVADPEFLADLGNLNMPVVPIMGDDFAAFLMGSYESLNAIWAQDPWIDE